MSTIKIRIKSIFGSILFEYESSDNTVKKTLLVAIQNGADLRGADLRGADLRGANLSDANLSRAENVPYLPTNLPEGEFIAYKKLPNGLIAKIKILEDSKRSRATTDKCRCDKALVLEFQNTDGTKSETTEFTSHEYATCTYKVGEIVKADEWDGDRWKQCSHGIHFFLDRQSAVNY